MGNRITKGVDKRGLKSPNKKDQKKDGKADLSQQEEAHMYDAVAEMPIYSVVNKRRKAGGQRQEELHYAEIQVLQGPPSSSRGSSAPALRQSSSTEYATIDFQPPPPPPHGPPRKASGPPRAASARARTAAKPAEIRIPSGTVKRPAPRPQPRKGTLV
ncbi:uncharacterized protein [Lepisosteus oculatus]|uniref:uncharacterized protein n=1 Tax=Lepisosteus oculatus TaxID=7918 RepID=UPI00073FAD88|nr:PREDICTED: translation initiation factor IF-2-like [Lepisosteus oculatus]